jgi:hypothetical protein
MLSREHYTYKKGVLLRKVTAIDRVFIEENFFKLGCGFDNLKQLL